MGDQRQEGKDAKQGEMANCVQGERRGERARAGERKEADGLPTCPMLPWQRCLAARIAVPLFVPHSCQ